MGIFGMINWYRHQTPAVRRIVHSGFCSALFCAVGIIGIYSWAYAASQAGRVTELRCTAHVSRNTSYRIDVVGFDCVSSTELDATLSPELGTASNAMPYCNDTIVNGAGECRTGESCDKIDDPQLVYYIGHNAFNERIVRFDNVTVQHYVAYFTEPNGDVFHDVNAAGATAFEEECIEAPRSPCAFDKLYHKYNGGNESFTCYALDYDPDASYIVTFERPFDVPLYVLLLGIFSVALCAACLVWFGIRVKQFFTSRNENRGAELIEMY